MSRNTFFITFCLFAVGISVSSNANDSFEVNLANSQELNCRPLASSLTGFGSSALLQCGTAEHPVFVNRFNSSQALALENGKPRLIEIKEIRNHGELVQMGSPYTMPVTKRSDDGTAFSELESSWAALALLGTYPTPELPKEASGYGISFPGTSTAQIPSDLSKAVDQLQTRYKAVKDQVNGAKEVGIDLGERKSLHCQRGNTPPGGACSFFSCEELTLNGTRYHALFYMPPIGRMQFGPRLPNRFLFAFDEDGLAPDLDGISVRSGATTLVNGQDEFLNNGLSPELPPALAKSKNAFQFLSQEGVLEQAEAEFNACQWSTEQKAQFGVLKSAFQNSRKKLVDTELVQLMDWINNAPVLKVVQRSTLSSDACLYEKTFYLTPQAQEKRSALGLPGSGSLDVVPVSPKVANELFQHLASMKIAFKYVADGCYARAELMIDELEKMGMHANKAWISSPKLGPAKDPSVTWRFHVAPVIQVKETDGTITQRVLDPSLSDHAVTVEEWARLSVREPFKNVLYTPPNATPVVFPYSNPLVYFTGRSTYIFGDAPSESTPDKIPQHLQAAISVNTQYLQYQQGAGTK